MRFDELLQWVGDEPVFESGLLLAGGVDPLDVRRQLSRWVRSGKLLQLRRGVYALNPPWRKTEPHPFVVANFLESGSYVSLQSALSHHGLIPENVPVTTSVGKVRTSRRETPLGSYLYRHLDSRYLGGYCEEELPGGQRAWVACPEKALLDLVHLEPDADQMDFLEALRLEDLDRLDFDAMVRWATELGRPKLQSATRLLVEMADIRSVGRLI